MKIFFILSILFASSAFAIGGMNMGAMWQNPEQPVFAKQLGAAPNAITSGSEVAGAATDGSGNVYIAGYTTGNLSSCNGVSANCTGKAAGSYDIFVSKYNSSGVWQWTKQFGHASKSTVPTGVAVSANGNVVITGYTAANLVSCNGVSANCAGNSQGSYDYFIVTYNSSGVWQWTVQMGQTGKWAYGYGIATDSSNAIYVTGYTSANLASCGGISANCSGNSRGSQDLYISKYNSSGVWQWTHQLGQSSKAIQSKKIAIDSGSNVYITGQTTANIPSCNGVSANCSGGTTGTADLFISKYNSSGTWLWSQQLGQSGKSATGNAIAIGSSDQVIVTGTTTGNMVSCAGVSASCTGSSQNSGAQGDYFVSQYDSSGVWQWTSQLGQTGTSTQTAWDVDTDSSGNSYVIGETGGNLESCNGVSANCSGSASGFRDYFVSKYNSSGAWQWTKQLGGGNTTYGEGISVDGSGRVNIVGSTHADLVSCGGVPANCSGGPSTGFNDYYIIQYNSSGTWQWATQLGSRGRETKGEDVATDSNGNVYVIGDSYSDLSTCNGVSANCSSALWNGYFLIKYNSQGVWQWTRTLGNSAYGTWALRVVIDSNDNIYLAGGTEANLVSCNGVSANCSGASRGAYDYFVSKYNSSGTWQWTRQLGATDAFVEAYGVGVDPAGNVFVTGAAEDTDLSTCGGVSANCTGSAAGGDADYFVTKYDSSGTWQWTKQLGTSAGWTHGSGVTGDSSGAVYVVGYSDGELTSCGGVSANCNGDYAYLGGDYFISKYSSSGVWQWTKVLSGDAAGVVVDGSGNAFVFGHTYDNLVSCNGVPTNCSGSSQGASDYFISKYNSSGVWQWTKQLGQTGKSINSGGISMDANGNLYVGGYTTGNLVSCKGVSANCSGSSQGGQDYFVAKYTSSGIWQWTRQLGQTDTYTSGKGVGVDKGGNVSITGAVQWGYLPSCNGISSHCSGASQGYVDMFVVKYRNW